MLKKLFKKKFVAQENPERLNELIAQYKEIKVKIDNKVKELSYDVKHKPSISSTSEIDISVKMDLNQLHLEREELKKEIISLRSAKKSEQYQALETKANFNSNHVFEVKHLNLFYGSKQSLFDVETNIKKNQVTALIGPSGSGKSTFLRTLNRMNDEIPNIKISGGIFFEGKNIYAKNNNVLELRTRVGMVFQKPTPFNMSIYNNISFPLRSHGIKDEKTIATIVERSLRGAALWDEVKDNLHGSATGLSGGQQQRLCIARAIALEPEVILMDEPTSALDPIATAKVEELILELKKRFTIVVVTHSMAQAQRISDDTVFFYQGRIIEAGTTRQIFTNPQKPRTNDYVSGKIG